MLLIQITPIHKQKLKWLLSGVGGDWLHNVKNSAEMVKMINFVMCVKYN